MKLKTAIFYQSVKNWDNNESNTFKADPTQIIELEDHLVKVSKEGRKEVIIVPTANLRYAIADYAEAYALPVVEFKGEEKPKIIESIKELESIKDSGFSKAASEIAKKGIKNAHKELDKIAHAKQ